MFVSTYKFRINLVCFKLNIMKTALHYEKGYVPRSEYNQAKDLNIVTALGYYCFKMVKGP